MIRINREIKGLWTCTCGENIHEDNLEHWKRCPFCGEKLEKEPDCVRLVGSYSTKEKCEVFDKLYDMAMSILNEARENGDCADEDDEHYCFEAIMELLGKDVWKLYNKYIR